MQDVYVRAEQSGRTQPSLTGAGLVRRGILFVSCNALFIAVGMILFATT